MFDQVYKYKQWADERTIQAILRVDGAGALKAMGFFCQQLNHMTIIEELFRARLLQTSEPHATTNTVEVPALAELVERNRTSNDWYLNYLTQLSAADLDQPLDFSYTAGNPGRMTRFEMLFHVVNHGTYHRGAISRALDLVGVAHPVDGYAKYVQDLKGAASR